MAGLEYIDNIYQQLSSFALCNLEEGRADVWST